MKQVSAAETSTDTLVEQTVTVEANRVEIEKSKGNVSDPSKENPEKLQIESFLLEDVEAKESKESRAQITMLKVDSALQKEREEIDLVVTETNVDPKKDNDFTNECQLCQFDTETVTMIEQLDSNPGSRRENVININHYATKKSVAESMLDVALFMANATQLKAVLEQGPSFHYYATLTTLISISLFLQVVIGILLIVIARLNLNDVTKQQRLDLLNNIATALVFFTVIFNIFITAFGVQKTGLYPSPYGRRNY
ncbi:UNVERIFIED_CONTAM: hypothetical protein K2H54_075081 [Gekko kuhli]